MSVPTGFKMTELGVIPNDWDAIAVADTFQFLRTAAVSRSRYVDNGSLHCVHYGDLHTKWQTVLNFSREAVPYVPDSYLKRADLIQEGDVIIADASEDVAGVGACAEVQGLTNKRAIGGLHTYVLRPRPAEWVAGFNGYVLQSTAVRTQIERLAAGLKVYGISKTALNSVVIPWPGKNERKFIADALSDMDEAVAAQEAVIAKKRALKTATMQALLSGARRLPGFWGEWERRSFDQLFQLLRNGSASRAALSAKGAIGYIHYGDIHANPRPHMDCGKGALPRIAREIVSRLPRVQEGDLLVADASEDYDGTGKSVEATNIGGDEVVAGLHTLLLRPIKKMAPGFAGYLQFIPEVKRQYVAAAQGVSVYGLSRSAVKSVSVALPRYEEQEAIASYLIDMEMDVSLQQDKLKKLMGIKVGMMQQLLTGKIRLI